MISARLWLLCISSISVLTACGPEFYATRLGSKVRNESSTGDGGGAPAPADTVTVPTWQNISFTPQFGTFTVLFDVVPVRADQEVIIGLSNGPSASESDLITAMRFGVNGKIEARHLAFYMALNEMPCVAGMRYHVRMVMSMTGKSFSVYVTPEGQSEVVLAQDFQPSAAIAVTTSLDNFAKYNLSGDAQISNFSVP